MREPNNDQFQRWNELHRSGRMIGPDRPVCRVTFQKRRQKQTYTTRPGPWRHIFFGDDDPPETEIEQVIQNVHISRAIGQDAATVTITITNDHPGEPDGSSPITGNKGYLTFDRGTTSKVAKTSVYALGDINTFPSYGFEDTYPVINNSNYDDRYATSWLYPPNIYQDVLIPNTLLYVYQGYGSDNFDENNNIRRSDDASYISPASDQQLVLRGVFMIDNIVYDAVGSITVQGRDVAKLLLDQVIYPPMLPLDRFPLIYCPGVKASGGDKVGKNVAKFSASSVDVYFGKNASLYGHRGSDAFDTRPDTYWLSIGNQEPNAGYSYEWIEATTGGSDVNEISLNLVGTNYTIFACVMENGVWQGTDVVPYDPNNPNSFPNGSNTNYVLRTTSGSQTKIVITLPRTYKAQKVRVTFTDLWDSGLGPYRTRAAVREMVVRFAIRTPKIASTVHKPGYITDWSEAVKELCGWGGLTWYDTYPAPTDYLIGDEKITGKNCRIWGDFENLGAGPIICTPGDFFLNKTFMDGIRTICDFLGCIFYIDESGGAVFRLPNIFSGGNFINDPLRETDVNTDEAYRRRQWPIEFHENANLKSYQVAIDDSQVRSEVLVVGELPNVNHDSYVAGGYVLGFNPIDGTTSAINFHNVLAGQQRLFMVPGDQTVLFKTEEECQRMAEMIGLFILFTYRKGNLTAPCHPGLQLDDQVRIFERVTNESYVHYVSAIDDTFDLHTGAWDMSVTTHWLGEDPDTQWFLNKNQLTPAVAKLPSVIRRIGAEAGDTTGLGGQLPITGSGATQTT